MRFVALLSFFLVNVTNIAALRSATELFEIDVSTDDNGGCKSNLVGVENYLKDSYKLVEAGIDLLHSYDSDRRAKRLVDAFFHGPDEGVRVEILHLLDQVQRFLDNGTGPFQGQPYLFCDSTWLTRIVNGHLLTLQDYAWTTEGPGHFVTNEKGEKLTIEQENEKKIEDYGPGYVYWSDKLKEYLFDGGDYTSPKRGFCYRDGNFGATQESTRRPTITLCPRTFKSKRIEDDRRIKSTTSANVKKEQVDGVSHLQKVIKPLAGPLTLYHELFHLIGTHDRTPDSSYAVKTIIDDLTTDKSAGNPETYAVISFAWWMTTHVDDTTEWFTGFATDDRPQKQN